MKTPKFIIFSAALSIISGVLVLIGWLFDISVLKSILPIWVSMKANTAICFVLTGVAMLLSQFASANAPALFVQIQRFCLFLLALTGLLTLSEYLFACNLGIDQWLIKDSAYAVGTTHPGRMAPETALCFVLLASALFLLNSQKAFSKLIAAGFGLLVANLALAALLTYFTPQLGAFAWFGFTVMAVHTGVLFVCLGIAVIAMIWQHKAMFWSLSNCSTLAFACGIFLLVLMGLNASRCQYWLKHTHQQIALHEKIVANLEAVFAEVIQTQTNTRGYLIAGDVRFLQYVAAAEANSLAKLKTISELESLDPEAIEQDHFKQLETDVKAGLEWQQQIIATNQAGMEDSKRSQMVRHGADLLAKLRKTIELAKKLHWELIDQLKQESENVLNFAYAITFGGTLTSLLFFLLTLLKLNSTEKKCQQTEDKNQQDRQRLEVFLRLAQMFNESNEEVQNFVVEQSIQLTASEMGFCGLIDADLQAMTTQVWSEKAVQNSSFADRTFLEQSAVFRLKEAGLWAETIRRKEAVMVNDYSKTIPGKQGLPAGHVPLQRFLGVPVIDNGDVLAVIAVANKVAEYNEEDSLHLRLLAEGVGRFLRHRQDVENLRQTNAYLENLINCANAPIMVWDAQLHITRINHAFELLIGRNEAEIIGQPLDVLLLFPPTQNENSITLFRQTLSGESWVGVEIEILHQDQSVHTVLWNSATLLAADGQTPLAIIAQGQDITERKQAERALKDSEEHLLLITNSLPVLISHVDTNLTCLFANNMFKEVFGYEPSELIGKNIAEILGEEILADVYPNIKKALTGERVSFEVALTDKNQQQLMMDATLVPHLIPGNKVDGFFTLVLDITERKQAEMNLRKAYELAEEANRAKSDFLSSMSHEMFTPMNAVLGFAQILECEDLTQEQQDFVASILNGGYHLLDLIKEVLDFSIIKSEKIELKTEKFELAALVQNCLALVRPLAAKKGIKIINATTCCHTAIVVADSLRFKQVLFNLLSNAIKYNREDGSISVSCELVQPQTLRLNITDTGAGLSDEQLGKLFLPFERLSAKNSAVEGAGLGLCISKRLIEAMNGRIGVESTVGVGSCFWLEIPLA